ncbi:efflux RND transporter periplasmic adaptor subunit [Rhizobacter sp. Root404]|uniref:efflux RND transporter periplasmic adaptor subunit n=1 Tax=Rhizobacter sp. Root404 TaxID=1736528 RepID=UPI0006FDCDC4|nr:efflux RND transporter periplasmic adaptor subunit [Rhizobacter sp. Root404]KQW36301.1 secretion protein HlyD [Rhizobacter sp. Root404]
MRKPWLVGGSVAIIVALVAVGVVQSRAKSADGNKDKKPDVTLEFTPGEVVKPLLAAMPERIEFSGPLMAPRTAVVRAKAAGTLLTLSVAEGSRVKAGQSLGTIDLSDLQSRNAERAAGVDSARARMAEAERIHKSNEDLANQKFISANALESSRASLEAARAQLKSAQAQLATSALGIREAALVAPISGVIGRRNVVPGEKVSAEQELMTVVDLKELELGGVVGTHQVSMLRPGQKLAVRVEGATEPVEGRIDRIAPMAEAGTRGIRVVVLLPNADERFRAGQYASALVSLDDPAPRLTVPVTSVGQSSGQDFVWTVENGALVRRLVITGRRDASNGRVEVTKGLAADAQVLAARFDTLKEGAPAKVVAKGAGSGMPAASASSAAPGKAS